MGYTNDLAEMAQRARERGLEFPDLRLVVGVGERMGPAERVAIAQGFAAPVCDSYGAVEAGNIAFECPSGSGCYHVQADNLLLEILADGKPAGPGAVGEVVVTPFNCRAMPLIRYRLGDLAAWGGPCPCGSALPTLQHLHGRENDIITTTSGRRLTPQAVNCAFCGHQELGRYRVRQHRRGVFTLELDAPDGPAGLRAAECLREILDPEDQLAVRRPTPLGSEREPREHRVIIVENR